MLPIIATFTSVLTVVSSFYAFLQKVRADLAHAKGAAQVDVERVKSSIDVAHSRIDMAKEQIMAVNSGFANKVGQLETGLVEAKQLIAVVEQKVDATPTPSS